MGNLDTYFGQAAGGGNTDVIAGFLQKLAIDCSSASQVVIKSGSKVGMDDGSEVVSVGSDITVDITSSGANGLDTGSEASDTWYYIWLIYNGTTAAGLLSTSSTAPTLPSGYTKKRLIGAVRNDSSSNFLQFSQSDYNYLYDKAYSLLNDSGSTSWIALTLANCVPSGLSNIVDIGVLAQQWQNQNMTVYTGRGTKSGSGSNGTLLGEFSCGNISSGDIVFTMRAYAAIASNILSVYNGGTTHQRYIWLAGFVLDI